LRNIKSTGHGVERLAGDRRVSADEKKNEFWRWTQVAACRDTGTEWFEQLLDTLFKPKEDKDDATIKNTEPPPQIVLACKQGRIP
jgi:hypothetical protein